MDLIKIRKYLIMGGPLTDLDLRVTFYSRVSTDHIEQKSSLINQKDYFVALIKNNKNWIYIPGYIDEGVTGTSDIKRDSFMQMINDAKIGKFDLIITKEISRFSRNTLDSIKYTRELLSNGVAVLFLNDNINTALPDSELRLTIMASMAQDEVRRLSERVKFGMQAAIKKGHILGNNMLYGYRRNETTKSFEIYPFEANIVKRIYTSYAYERKPLNQIAKELNNESILSPQNKKWSITTLKRMITNPKYKGYYCGNKKEVIDYITKKTRNNEVTNWVTFKSSKIPVIVNEELWDLANKRITERNDKKKYENHYPLSSKIFCEIHKTSFHRRMQCKNDITWMCSEYLKNGKQKCDTANIRESELYIIFKDIFKTINKDNIKSILLNIYKEDIKTDDVINYEIKMQKERIINLYINNLINYDELLNKIKNLSEYQSDSSNKLDLVKIEKYITNYLNSNKLINDLLNILLIKITASKKQNTIFLKIHFNKNIKYNKTFNFERQINNKKLIIKYFVCAM